MKKILAFTLTIIMAFSAVTAFAGFSDIDDSTLAWAGEAVDYLSDAKIINGYEDGTFKPEANVTRAEFAKMVAVAFELEKSDAVYTDVANHWAKDYISMASGVMYTAGENFEPDKAATRADIAYCASSALGLELKNSNYIKDFSDYGQVDSAMLSAVGAAAENGIVKGYEDGTLKPNNSVTRAEAAVILYRALQLKDSAAPSDEEVTQEPEIEQEQEVVQPSEKEEVNKEELMDHISNLYPGKELIYVISCNHTFDNETDEELYKISYYISGDDTEYSSYLELDTKVTGVKSSVQSISSGDVLIMNTAFYGYIGNLHVFASFGSGKLIYDPEIVGYGKGDYTLVGGKIVDINQTSKSTAVTIEADGEVKTIYVTAECDVREYTSWQKGDKWSFSDFGNIDPETEERYVYARITNSVVSDVIISNFDR